MQPNTTISDACLRVTAFQLLCSSSASEGVRYHTAVQHASLTAVEHAAKKGALRAILQHAMRCVVAWLQTNNVNPTR